ncbi:MAG: hypothetical protein ACUVWX_11400 [Kiritimatiellia bacterium]
MLNQFTADCLGLPVLGGPEEATAVGNCMVQALGLKIVSSLAEAVALIRSAFPIKEYRPQNHERWSVPYQRCKHICGRMAKERKPAPGFANEHS